MDRRKKSLGNKFTLLGEARKEYLIINNIKLSRNLESADIKLKEGFTGSNKIKR